jgi:hypothetical protein
MASYGQSFPNPQSRSLDLNPPVLAILSRSQSMWKSNEITIGKKSKTRMHVGSTSYERRVNSSDITARAMI